MSSLTSPWPQIHFRVYSKSFAQSSAELCDSDSCPSCPSTGALSSPVGLSTPKPWPQSQSSPFSISFAPSSGLCRGLLGKKESNCLKIPLESNLSSLIPWFFNQFNFCHGDRLIRHDLEITTNPTRPRVHFPFRMDYSLVPPYLVQLVQKKEWSILDHHRQQTPCFSSNRANLLCAQLCLPETALVLMTVHYQFDWTLRLDRKESRYRLSPCFQPIQSIFDIF